MKPGDTGRRRVLRSVNRGIRHVLGTLRSVRSHLSSNLHNLGIDLHDSMVAGYGDAVVAIPNKVGLSYLCRGSPQATHLPCGRRGLCGPTSGPCSS